MSKFYKETPGHYPSEPSLQNGELRGHAWSIIPTGEKYVLSFISGALGGHLISIEISEQEYMQLKEDKLSIQKILLSHGVG